MSDQNDFAGVMEKLIEALELVDEETPPADEDENEA